MKTDKAYGAACVPAGRELDYDTEAVDDAVAIVEQVRALPELASDSVYVLGHSLGGTLAPRIAGRSKGLAGIIILAGLARPLEDALEEQFYYTSSLTDSSVNVKAQLDELKQQLVNVKSLVPKSSMRQFPYHWGSPAHIGCLPTLTNRWRLPLN